MKNLIAIALLFVTTVIKAQEKHDTTHAGANLTVCGIVESVNVSKSNITYINFNKEKTDSPYTGVIFARDTINFTAYKPKDFLTGKNICISGIVSIYKDKPQIVIKSPKQIRVVEKE
ncbi:MAG: hypothetical protein ABI723_02910 [Bacteroidia bacterium]